MPSARFVSLNSAALESCFQDLYLPHLKRDHSTMYYLASIETWWRIDKNMTKGARFRIFQKRSFMKECRHPQSAFIMASALPILNFLWRQIQAPKARRIGLQAASRGQGCTLVINFKSWLIMRFQNRWYCTIDHVPAFCHSNSATATLPEGMAVAFSRLQHITIVVHCITDITV